MAVPCVMALVFLVPVLLLVLLRDGVAARDSGTRGDHGRGGWAAVDAVALVGRRAGGKRWAFVKAAAGAGVVELDEFAVVVAAHQGFERREVDVRPVVADCLEPGEFRFVEDSD